MAKRPVTSPEPADEHDYILEAVALRLREARLKAKLTQAQLAEKAGVKQSWVYELETGTVNVTVRTLAKMAEILDLDLGQLLPRTRQSVAEDVAVEPYIKIIHKAVEVISDRNDRDMELLSALRAILEKRKA